MAWFVFFASAAGAAARTDVATDVTPQTEIADLGTLHRQGHWLPALKAARAIEIILARHNLLGAGGGPPDSQTSPS
jgi:hypothetical protein